MIIDSHAHLSIFKFENTFPYLAIDENGKCVRADGSREQLIAQMKESGITHVIEPAITCWSNNRIIDLAEKYPGFIHPAVGVHPRYVYGEVPISKGLTCKMRWRDRSIIRISSVFDDVVAIGETGLDYHYRWDKRFKRWQKKWFKYQIRLADKRKLPLILHIRDADDDAIEILSRYKKKLHGGVVHCFCGNAETAGKYLDLGFHLGIGGALLQSEERSAPLKEAVKAAPLERILVETDAPYVLPAKEFFAADIKKKKLRNTPLLLPLVIQEIAKIKGITPEEAEQAVYENTMKLFNL